MSGRKTDLISADIAEETWTAGNTGWQAYPTNGEIARLAYHLYEARGRRDGHDVDDWVLAERELTRRYDYQDAGESSRVAEIAAISALRNGSTLRS